MMAVIRISVHLRWLPPLYVWRGRECFGWLSEGGMPRVLVKDLVKAFDGSAALARVNLEVQAARLTAIVGPSGCGKTTLLHVIAGLERPDSGEVEIDGECLSSPARGVFVPAAQRNIGMVFQSYALWPH